MTEPVEAALWAGTKAAVEESCLSCEWGEISPGVQRALFREFAAGVAKFHRAIAHHHRCSGLDAEDYEALAMRHDHWAEAVERAGKESDNG